MIFPKMTEIIFAMERPQFQDEKWNEARLHLSKLVEDMKCIDWSSLFPQNRAFELSRFLFQKIGFQTSVRQKSVRFTLCGVLNYRIGSCLGLATLFMVLSDIFRLGFYPLLLEGHILLINQETESPIFLETSQDKYTFQPIIAEQTIVEHGKILTREEFLAVHLSNRAVWVYVPSGLMDDAVFLIDSALEIFPDYTAGWINRAVIMKKLDNVGEMKRSLDTAKSLNPGVRYTRAIEQIEKINF